MKRTSLIVLSFHLFALILMALESPKKKEEKPRPLVIQTILLSPKGTETQIAAAAPSSAPQAKKSTPQGQRVKSQAAPTPKKVAPPQVKATGKPQQTHQKKGTSSLSPTLLKELQESIAKIDRKTDKGLPTQRLVAPKAVPKLSIDQPATSADGPAAEGSYHGALASYLQQELLLPEVGEVRVSLTLNCEGKCLKVEILSGASKENRNWLIKELETLSFPPFDGALKKEKEHTFVITFFSLSE